MYWIIGIKLTGILRDAGVQSQKSWSERGVGVWGWRPQNKKNKFFACNGVF